MFFISQINDPSDGILDLIDCWFFFEPSNLIEMSCFVASEMTISMSLWTNVSPSYTFVALSAS